MVNLIVLFLNPLNLKFRNKRKIKTYNKMQMNTNETNKKNDLEIKINESQIRVNSCKQFYF